MLYIVQASVFNISRTGIGKNLIFLIHGSTINKTYSLYKSDMSHNYKYKRFVLMYLLQKHFTPTQAVYSS